MPSASARHILVSSRTKCLCLKQMIKLGSHSFEQLAKEYSKCPSSIKGGNIEQFTQGTLSPEFEKVVFKKELNKVHGPIKTKYGYHLIEILSRED